MVRGSKGNTILEAIEAIREFSYLNVKNEWLREIRFSNFDPLATEFCDRTMYDVINPQAMPYEEDEEVEPSKPKDAFDKIPELLVEEINRRLLKEQEKKA